MFKTEQPPPLMIFNCVYYVPDLCFKVSGSRDKGAGLNFLNRIEHKNPSVTIWTFHLSVFNSKVTYCGFWLQTWLCTIPLSHGHALMFWRGEVLFSTDFIVVISSVIKLLLHCKQRRRLNLLNTYYLPDLLKSEMS